MRIYKLIFAGAAVCFAPAAYASMKNITASARGENHAAVDELLSRSLVERGNVRLPHDGNGLLYNKANRLYASGKIKQALGENTKRTAENICSEIFAHEFIADMIYPFRKVFALMPEKLDIYSRVAYADIDEKEKRLLFFSAVEKLFEHE